jgi:predicted transposase YbfD/YdcC
MVEEYFGRITDQRKKRGKRHKLIDIITIVLCGMLCGADDWVAIAAFGRAKEKWFREFLELPHDIPSHDTFGDVFAWIDPEEFRASFLGWVQALVGRLPGQIVGVDGKTLRGSQNRRNGQDAIEMVSAWAQENEVVLGQVKVAADSNEIKAIPQLLKLLQIKGCLVTIDAIGCQTEIADQILAQDADYLLALKENQGLLYEDTVQLFEDLARYDHDPKIYAHQHTKSTNKGHGRIEVRECWVIDDPELLKHFRTTHRWPNLTSIVKIKAQRTIDEKTSSKNRYYICSLEADATYILKAVRAHWHIENSLHWVLDVAFQEDHSRVRKGHAAENLAVLRHVALNLLKHDRSKKLGIKNKRLLCSWDHDYLLHIISP